MKIIVKALKWAYGDSLRYIGFLLAMAAFVAFLMTLIAYPVQTIATAIIGTAAICLFIFFDEVGR